MTDTTIPTVTDALLTAFEAIPNVVVQDGPKPRAVGASVIAVGVGAPSFSQRLAHAKGLALLYDESYSINCALWDWTAVKDAKPHRDRCVELLAAIRSALEPDKTLGGLCEWVEMGARFEWMQTYQGEGAACQVNFTLDVRATI